MSSELLTVEEVAERLKVAPYTVREWLKQGTMHGIKLNGRYWRVRRDDLEAFTSEQPANSVVTDTMLLSEAVLARDWLRPEEDEAWADL